MRKLLKFEFARVVGFLALFSSVASEAQELALNWKPEPEFGGFYEALIGGAYERAGLKVSILPGGAGQPVTQMVAAKKVEFGIAAADEIILARSQGAKVTALFAVYRDDPQGFMVHEERGIKTLKELFQSPGQIALQKGLPYTLWLEKLYAPVRATLVPYTGGITSFLRDPKFSQQCFITAEPIAARREGKKPRTLLISESGFNPYLAVVIAHEDLLKDHPERVKRFIAATREGWKAYLQSPDRTNVAMQKLNPSMDLATFEEGARIQKRFIETPESRGKKLGSMEKSRWERLYGQLRELNLVKAGLDVSGFYRDGF
jgi:NitT/TauT family transport system substrate-binding protein